MLSSALVMYGGAWEWFMRLCKPVWKVISGSVTLLAEGVLRMRGSSRTFFYRWFNDPKVHDELQVMLKGMVALAKSDKLTAAELRALQGKQAALDGILKVSMKSDELRKVAITKFLPNGVREEVVASGFFARTFLLYVKPSVEVLVSHPGGVLLLGLTGSVSIWMLTKYGMTKAGISKLKRDAESLWTREDLVADRELLVDLEHLTEAIVEAELMLDGSFMRTQSAIEGLLRDPKFKELMDKEFSPDRMRHWLEVVKKTAGEEWYRSEKKRMSTLLRTEVPGHPREWYQERVNRMIVGYGMAIDALEDPEFRLSATNPIRQEICDKEELAVEDVKEILNTIKRLASTVSERAIQVWNEKGPYFNKPGQTGPGTYPKPIGD